MTAPIHAIHVFGVKEPHGPGISTTFLNALDPTRFQPVPIPVAIDYGFPVPFEECTRLARAAVIEAILAAPGPVMLSGYSGGALIIGDLVNDVAFGQVAGVDESMLRGVALLADPKRPDGCGAPGLPTPLGYGIAGQRPVNTRPVFWGTTSRDPISACEWGNPLRTVADLSTLWSADPRRAGAWALDVIAKLKARQLQPWWMHPFSPAQDFTEAIDALWRYSRTAHTRDYLDQGICTGLAAAVNEAVS